jgi:ribosomal protein S18 acetylase RimI-like enzyme
MTTPARPRIRMVIRPAEPADLEAITAVDAAAWQHHYAPHVAPELAESWLVRIPYMWRRSFADRRPDFVIRVAEADGQVAGFFAAERARLWSLQVLPEFARRGIGRALFAEADLLCGPGIFLHALAASRRDSGFWERRGLRVVAEIKDVFLDAEIPTLIYGR